MNAKVIWLGTKAGAILLVGLFIYVVTLTIEQRDAYAYHDFELTFSPRPPVLPGDVVTVDQQNEIIPICKFTDLVLKNAPDALEVYYNKWSDNLDRYQRVLASFLPSYPGEVLAADSEENTEVQEVIFFGTRLAADESGAAPVDFDRIDCEEKMAEALIEGLRVCTVVRSMIVRNNSLGVIATADNSGTILRQVVAVQFKDRMDVPKAKLQSVGFEAEKIAEFFSESCRMNTLPLDVRIRKHIGIVAQRQTASLRVSE